MSVSAEDWLRVTGRGLYCEPGGFYVDPTAPVDRAVITHGHADHARPGHEAVLATAETLAIMAVRYGDSAGVTRQSLGYGETLKVGEVEVRLAPAGHVLGSAQAVLEWRGSRVVVSGDYKRRRDPTCPAFEPVGCDVFITEATFGLPVFRHPPADQEVAKVLASLAAFPERPHVIGAYALGKAQRVIALLREAGFERPIYLHGALARLTRLYQDLGLELGDLRPVAGVERERLRGEIVMAPPSALADRWSRRLEEPVTAMASGWMRVRQRARQRGVELPLVISDHADWDELTATLSEVGAPEVWVTHGNEEALVHQAAKVGLSARALSLVGRGEAEQETEPEAEPEAESIGASA